MLKLPCGEHYISELLGCDTKTIQQELNDLEDEDVLKKTYKRLMVVRKRS